MKKVIFIVAILAVVSCKKESQESFGKSETTTEIQKFMLFIGNFDVLENSIFVYQKPFR